MQSAPFCFFPASKSVVGEKLTIRRRMWYNTPNIAASAAKSTGGIETAELLMDNQTPSAALRQRENQFWGASAFGQ